MKVTLHIGMEKTGSTSIQRALAADREALQEEGVLFPRLFGSENHMELAVAAMKPNASDELQIIELSRQQCSHAQYKERLARQLASEKRSGAFQRIILSNEHCHSRLTTVSEIASLPEIVGEDPSQFEIIIYLGRQDRIAVSLYSTIVRLGGAGPVFPGLHTDFIPYYFSYDRILQNYSSVFGPERISIRLFEKGALLNRDVVDDFYDAVGLTRKSRMIYRANTSLSKQQIWFLERFNRRFPLLKSNTINSARAGIVNAIKDVGKGTTFRPKRSDALAFYEKFREGNSHVSDNYDLNLSGNVLFDEDFSDYPEILDDYTPSTEEIFDFVEAIWTFKNGCN